MVTFHLTKHAGVLQAIMGPLKKKKNLFGPHPIYNLLSILLIGCSGPSHDCWLHRVSKFTVYHTSNHKISKKKKRFDSIVGHPITVLVTKVPIITEAPLLLNILECRKKTGLTFACCVFL